MQEEQLFPVFVTLLQEIIVFLHRKYQIIEDNATVKAINITLLKYKIHYNG